MSVHIRAQVCTYHACEEIIWKELVVEGDRERSYGDRGGRVCFVF